MSAAITVESIEKASAQFWEQMLSMRLVPCLDAHQLPEVARCIGSRHVVAHCDLSGVWVGRIEVRLSPGLALQATSAMLMQPVEAVEPADTLDATKEIANMIAGTLKSALPRPCAMTVPSAQVEADDFCVLPRTSDSVTVFFRHDAGELMVRVWEQTPVDTYASEAETAICV
jgi:CheY-specific phosphatase CheX